MAFNPELGGTSPAVLLDNAERLDKLVNGDALTEPDRAGVDLDTWRGFMAKNDEIRQNLVPLSKQYMTLEAAQADIANIADGSTTYVRSPDGGTLADEYINNGGTLAATGRAMPSMSALKTGYITGDAKSDAEIVAGLVIYADGSTASSPTWNAWYLKVRAGETVTYSGTVGSNTAGEQMAYLIQLDANKAFVASLAEWTSTGNVTDKATLSAVATQDGYMYVRVRDTADFTLTQRKKTILVETDIDAAGGVASYASYQNVLANKPLVDITSSQSTAWVTGRVIYADGTRTDAAGESWRAAYVPVKKGDVLEYHGEIGSATPDELMAYIVQLDTGLNVVANLATYTSTGVQKAGVLSGVATQDGFAYIRVRVTDPAAVIYQSRERFTPGADVFGIKTEASLTAANRVTTDVTNVSTTTHIIGRVMSADGSVVDNAGDSWKAAYLPVKAGEVIQYHGQIGSGTSGQVLAYIIQLDSAMKFVAPLATYTSPGSSSTGVMTGVATQDGFVYVRVRLTDPAATITKTTQLFSLPGNVYAVMNPADIVAANRTTLDVTSAPDTYTIPGRVIYSGGLISDTAGENWKAAYVPVRAGDIVRYFGQIGSGTAGEIIAYIIQLDAAMAVVANLATYTSPGVTSNGVMAGVATQDGFVYVRIRVTTPAATITLTSQDKAFASDLRGPVKTIDYT
ncbi:hypothetical protein N7410_30130, partial [Klebsiella pasteurii]|nr:hypothetical protein [Klebsiella pasteurii]